MSANAEQKMILPIFHHVLNQKSKVLNGPIPLSFRRFASTPKCLFFKIAESPLKPYPLNCRMLRFSALAILARDRCGLGHQNIILRRRNR